MHRIFEKTIAEFGSLDILVNNAGAIHRAPAAEYPWKLGIMIAGPDRGFRLSQLAGRHMLQRGTAARS